MALRGTLRVVFALAIALPLFAPMASAQTRYTITNLGLSVGSDGAAETQANGVNNSGQVAGISTTVLGDTYAFYSTGPSGPLEPVGALNSGTGINDSGLVCGFVLQGFKGVKPAPQSRGPGSGTPPTYGPVYPALTTLTYGYLQDTKTNAVYDLQTLSGGTTSCALGINNNGLITGYADISTGAVHAIISDSQTNIHDVGTLPNYPDSYGLGINATGQIAGELVNSTTIHAFLTGANGASMRDLGVLSGGSKSTATAVNASGQVTGQADTSTGALHAFYSDANGGTFHDLGTLGGSTSQGNGINDSGEVVGYSYMPGNTIAHAFVTSNGTMVDLNTLVSGTNPFAYLETATGVSNSGYISGYAVDNSGNTVAFAASPVSGDATPFSGASLGNGLYDSSWFGYYSYTSYPLVYQYYLGYEYVYSAGGGVTLYDYKSGHFWYTQSNYFPFIYDFTLNCYLYYYDANTPKRHFYEYSASNPGVITE